jgi:outer membrane protein TolC
LFIAGRRFPCTDAIRPKAGTVSYLNVIAAQTTALTNETTAVQLRGRRMTAAVLLIQALVGGWKVVDLPSAQAVTARE